MNEISKQLLAWLGRLLPKQDITGNSNVQVGQVKGNFTVVNNHHHGPTSVPAPRATAEHREVLRLMHRVPDRIAILEFMDREFRTRMVIELTPTQTYRLRRYVEVVISKTEGSKHEDADRGNRRA